MNRTARVATLALMFAAAAATPNAASAAPKARARGEFATFDRSLDSLVRALHVPGLSAAIVRNGKVAWSKGYGFADRERRVRATPATPYRLASVTKPIAASLIMKLVEDGRLDLDLPMRSFSMHAWFAPGGGSWAHYPSRYVEKPITVRQVLTHTSESDPPGEAYKYNGSIYADLTWVIESVTGQSYPVAMRDSIVKPLRMSRTVPGQLAPWGQKVVRDLAKPYAIKDGVATPGTYPGFGIEPDTDVSPWNLKPAFKLPAATDSARRAQLGQNYTPLYSAQTAAGMISTVEDLARFDIAFDAGRIVSAATRESMFTASENSKGEALPYGLGWFVEEVGGKRLVWHYGWFPPTVSAFYLKVPEKRLTLVLLANCDALSANMAWTANGVRASPFAKAFLEKVAGVATTP